MTLPVGKIPAGLTAEQAAVVASQAAAEAQQQQLRQQLAAAADDVHRHPRPGWLPPPARPSQRALTRLS
jgi:hypothetical protein